MGKRTHYEVLGLDRTATLEEVKKAYRRQAMARHPDRNPGDPDAARRFRRVVEAYEVLGRESSRAAYDAFLGRSAGSDRILTDAMAGFRTPAMRLEVRISHAQAARGVRMSVDLPRGPVCPECGGDGRTAGRTRGCGRCGGTGRVRRSYGPVSEEVDCPVCGGRRGLRNPCPRCGGLGRLGRDLSCLLDIPPGVRDGDVVLLSGGPCAVEAVIRVA